MTTKRVVHVGDVARVASELVRGINEFTPWEAVHVPVPVPPPADSRLRRAGQLAERVARLLGPVSRQITAAEPDVVHIHWAQNAPWVRAGAKPVVVHVHGSDVRFRSSSLAFRPVEWALRRADLIQVVTPDLLAYVPNGATVAPNPVDTRFWAPRARTGDGRVLIHARLSPIKGGTSLVDAGAQLVSAGIEVRSFAGGEYDDEARSVGVTLLPKSDKAGVREEILQADVVIGQARLGILSLSELEAMACERPVVMPFDRRSVPDVPVASVSAGEEIAERVLALLRHPEEAEELGRRGRRYVVDRHDLAAVARRLVCSYEGLT